MELDVMPSSLVGRWENLQTITVQSGKSHNERQGDRDL